MSEPRSRVLSAEARRAIAEEIVPLYPHPLAALLPALHRITAELGHIPPWAMEEVAGLLGIPPVRVFEAVTFYDMFHAEPVGRRALRVCRNLSCALRGGESLISHLERRLGVEVGGTTPDGRYTLEAVECLASCGTAPMMQVGDRYYENLTPEAVDRLFDEWGRGDG